MPTEVPQDGPVDRVPEQWFLAAYALLAEGGAQAVTITGLCDRLRVTKGAFYHRFADLPSFVAAFAARWQAWATSFVEAYLQEPDPLRRLETALNRHDRLSRDAEPQFRAWGRTEPVIARALRELEEVGQRFGRATFAPIVGDEPTGELLSLMGSALGIGMQQSFRSLEPDRWIPVVAAFARDALHVDVRIEQRENRPYARVLGATGQPVPVHRRDTAPQQVNRSAAAAPIRTADTATARRPTGREQFFTATWQSLAEDPFEELTIAAICTRVGVTRGSFHHHFSTMAGFIEALAEQWETQALQVLQEWAALPDPLARLARWTQSALRLDAPAASAWRAWGRNEPLVRAALRHVEARTVELLTQALIDLRGDPAAADVLAESAVALSVGLVHFEPRLDPSTATTVLVEWHRRCLHLQVELDVDGTVHLTPGHPGS